MHDVDQHNVVTVRLTGQNVELLYTLCQPVQVNNEVAGWIIDHTGSVPHGVNLLFNNGMSGYSVYSLNN